MRPLDKFTQAYIECALWASVDENDEPLDVQYSIIDIAPEAIEQMVDDCVDFQQAQRDLLSECPNYPDLAGHDFWLTRNRHGAGFWDRGLGEVGQKLTEAAHAYGSCDLYVGDDGRIYAI